VWIDPDLEIVAVRMGEDLSAGSEPFHAALDRYLAAPLYAALEEAGPSRSNGPGVAEAPRIRDDPSAPCAD
jgi:hypothetical protein